MVKELGDLRKLRISEIVAELFQHHHCDPDVAVVMAWWVNHNRPPRNWSALKERILNRMYFEVQNSARIPAEFVAYIQRNYEENKTGNNQSLLPLRQI